MNDIPDDDANAEMAGVLMDVVELCESGEFCEDIFLNFIREGHTIGLVDYTRNYFSRNKP